MQGQVLRDLGDMEYLKYNLCFQRTRLGAQSDTQNSKIGYIKFKREGLKKYHRVNSF